MAKTFRRSRLSIFLQPLILLIVGVFLLIFRNADPLLNPLLYTEDGMWLGMGMTHGWAYTFYYAKDGYLVWGNLITLWFANAGSQIFCNDRLICLPEAVAVISYIFFSFLAVLSFFFTKSYLHIGARVALFLLIIFIPLGDSSNEILGRLSNIGYYFVFISLILIIIRDAQTSFTSKFIIDVALIICMATNPVCIPLILFYLASSFITSKKTFFCANYNLFLSIGFLLLLSIFVIKRITALETAVKGQLNFDNLIEVILARSILYPFIFPFYAHLNNLITIGLFTLWGILIGLGFFTADKVTRKILLISLASLLLNLMTTIFMRQSLTEQLDNYTVTFPDRYFMGINIIVIFITLISLNSLFINNHKVFSCAIYILIIFLYTSNFRSIIEYKSPKLPITMDEKLIDQVCLNVGSNWLEKSPNVFIITSTPWSIEVPSKTLQESALKLECQRVYDDFYLSDVSWTSGVFNTAAAFFVFNSTLTREIFSPGTQIRLKNGELRKILSTSQHGKYLHVYLEGEILNVKIHGRPNSYRINQ